MTAFVLLTAAAALAFLAAPLLALPGLEPPAGLRPLIALVLTLLLGAAAVCTLVDGPATGTPGDVRVIPALVLTAAGGAVVVPAVLARLGAPPPADPPAPTVLRGGTWIGVLERLAVLGSIAARWPEGIAVVVAVKGLGRYPELRGDSGHPRALTAETFIIGTLVSLVWCAACAYVGLGPLRLTR